MSKTEMERLLEIIEGVRLMIDDIDGMQFGKVPKALDHMAFNLDAVIHRMIFNIKVAP